MRRHSQARNQGGGDGGVLPHSSKEESEERDCVYPQEKTEKVDLGGRDVYALLIRWTGFTEAFHLGRDHQRLHIFGYAL